MSGDSADNGGAPSLYGAEDAVAETLAIEQRLLDRGYGTLPAVLQSGGDFEFEGDTVEAVVAEAQRYLAHQQSVELAGARVLAAIGELAVKAQAFDAIASLVKAKRA
jgi:hypothetical protein